MTCRVDKQRLSLTVCKLRHIIASFFEHEKSASAFALALLEFFYLLSRGQRVAPYVFPFGEEFFGLIK